jgi:translocation and assembly module TamB
VPVRSQRRRWLLRGLLMVFVVALLLVLGVTWLLRSGSGRDFALARVLASLPADSLSWQRAEGTVNGPLQLYGVRYEHEGLRIEAERVLIDPAPIALIGRTLQIEQLVIEQGTVALPPGSETPEPWPQAFTLPEQLPSLQFPLAVSIEALAIRGMRVVQGELGLIELTSVDAVGRFERGRVELERLSVESDRGRLQVGGALDSARRWDTGLQASLDLAGFGDEPLPLTIDAKGDLEDLTLTATARLPDPATLTLRLVGGLPNPRWTLVVSAPGIEPARLGIDAPSIALDLSGQGDLAHATLSGNVNYDGRAFRLMPSTLRYADGSVRLDPLALQLNPGSIDARGSVDLRGAAPLMALDLTWHDIEWPGATPAETARTRGQARIDGPSQDYVIGADAELVRGTEQAKFTLRGRGGTTQMTLERLSLVMPQGSLDAAGEVEWDPHPRWDLRATLEDFDPGWLQPDFPGAVDASLVTAGEMIDGKPRGAVTFDPIGGTLRGRALAGRIETRIDEAEHGEATLDLRVGESRLRGSGRWSERIDAKLELAPLLIEDLLPQSKGRLSGTLVVSGSRDRPTLIADLDGEALVYESYEAERLRLRSRTDGAEQGKIEIEAENLVVADQRIATLAINAEGTRASHDIVLAVGADVARLEGRLKGGERDGTWRGELQALSIVPHDRDEWRLDAPSALVVDTGRGAVQLDSSCLRAAESSLCTTIAWQESVGDASFRLEAFPLQTFDPFLTESLQTPASAYGEISAEGQMRRAADGTIAGEIHVRSDSGGLRLDPESPRELLTYRQLQIDGRLSDERAELTASASLGEEGELRANISNERPLSPDGALQGQVLLKLRNLAFLELVSDQIADARGQVDAALTLGGTRVVPALQGRATLAGFSAEIPALGIALREGQGELRSEGTSAARIVASVRSGEGEVRVEGRLDAAPDAASSLELAITGDDFVASATPDLAATVSPDLTLSLGADRLKLRGEIEVDRARINLERLDGATTVSDDVVILDSQTARTKATAVDSEIGVVLGEDVRLVGFGLKGKLDGRITLRDRPGRASVARGGVQVSGEYKAYGQDLKITRGQLSYASTPLDNPTLDLRAEREIDDITVGVQVRGTALAPQLTLWSNPALDQAEQLSYLVLGRPLRSASQADGSQLTQAAAAFGGNLLAQRLGARMGVDEIGVADSRALGGAALTVGKYLSPKLYVSYGVALFGTGQVVTFKYLLSRVWSVQIDSGTENRAALNYRLER